MEPNKKLFIDKGIMQVSELVKGVVIQLQKRYHPNMVIQVSDLAWDCFTTLYTRRFFDKYDYTKSKENTYLNNGVKNYLIDQERKLIDKPKQFSLDMETESGNTYAEMLDSKVSGASINVEAYLEAIKVLKPELSGVFAKDRGIIVEGNTLSPYAVLYMTLKGYNNGEIADMFNTNTVYVSKVYGDALEFLKKKAQVDITEESVDIIGETKKNVRCGMCGCEHTKPAYKRDGSEYRSDTGFLFYYCHGCKTYNTAITGSFLSSGMTNVNRMKFLVFCEELRKDRSIGEVKQELGIPYATAWEWYNIQYEYFKGKSKYFFTKQISYWREIITEAVEWKANNKKQVLVNDNA